MNTIDDLAVEIKRIVVGRIQETKLSDEEDKIDKIAIENNWIDLQGFKQAMRHEIVTAFNLPSGLIYNESNAPPERQALPAREIKQIEINQRRKFCLDD